MDAIKKPIFRNLHADDDPEATEIQSLCMNCFKDVSKITNLTNERT